MKRILIFSHNSQRDIFADKILKEELQKRGYSVIIRRLLAGDREAICIFQPHIIVLPELRCEYSINLAKQFRAWGGKVVVRLCEMGITRESIQHITEEYKDAIFGNYSMNDSVDLMLAWGTEQAQLIKENTDVDHNKIVSVGGIAFDQYFFPYDGVKKADRPILLFATGFPYADRNDEFAIPEAKCGQRIHSEWANIGRKGRSDWLKMIKLVHTYFGDKYILNVMPHPGERYEGYQAILGGIANIIQGSSAFVEVNRSDIVVHAGSTIGYEAHLVKKPAFCYKNVCQDVISSAMSPNINCPLELIKAIEGVKLGESNADLSVIETLERGYYGPVDGKSYSRCIDEIDKIDIQKDPSTPEHWPQNSQPLDSFDADIVLSAAQWHCGACGNKFYVVKPHREMIQCPYCGIACVRIQVPNENKK